MSQTSTNNEPPDEKADYLLSNVTQNRIRRLAKSILSSTIEFVLAILTILFEVVRSVEESNDQEVKECMRYCTSEPLNFFAEKRCQVHKPRFYIFNKDKFITVMCDEVFCDWLIGDFCDWVGSFWMSPANIIFVGILTVYVLVLAFWSFWKARKTKDRPRIRPKVEEAYAKTNRWPIIDGFLEIAITVQYAGLWFALIVWFLYLSAIGIVIAIFTVTDLEGKTSTIVLPSILASLQMYKITSNVSELAVLTSPKGMSNNTIFATFDEQCADSVPAEEVSSSPDSTMDEEHEIVFNSDETKKEYNGEEVETKAGSKYLGQADTVDVSRDV